VILLKSWRFNLGWLCWDIFEKAAYLEQKNRELHVKAASLLRRIYLSEK
jgi:hypothetical protein